MTIVIRVEITASAQNRFAIMEMIARGGSGVGEGRGGDDGGWEGGDASVTHDVTLVAVGERHLCITIDSTKLVR